MVVLPRILLVCCSAILFSLPAAESAEKKPLSPVHEQRKAINERRQKQKFSGIRVIEEKKQGLAEETEEEKKRQELLKQLDQNGDGIVSETEAKAAHAEVLKILQEAAMKKNEVDCNVTKGKSKNKSKVAPASKK